MSGIITLLNNKLKGYYNVILTVFLVLLFGVILLFLYKRHKEKNVSSKAIFKDVANSGKHNGMIEVKFFHVNWCPHCKTALPEWNAFKNQYNGKVVRGIKVECVEMDCTDSDSPEVAFLMKENNIDAFPTVFISRNNERYDFDAKITKTSLEKFMNAVIST
jgi:thiol-disulfide isomerase/thioredoxin